MDATVIAAIVASATSVAQVFVHYFKDKKMKILEHQLNNAKEEELKTDIKINVLNKLLKISVYSQINNAVSKLMQDTNVEGFTIFVATNGKADFNKVAVIYEKYKQSEAIESFIKEEAALALYRSISIDEHYKAVLKQAERSGSVYLETQNMPECMLKNIYLYEDIQHSGISFLFRKMIDDQNDVMCFCSAVTIDNSKITGLDKTILELTISSSIIPALLQSIE